MEQASLTPGDALRSSLQKKYAVVLSMFEHWQTATELVGL